MGSVHVLSRRQFLIVASATATGLTLGACNSKNNAASTLPSKAELSTQIARDINPTFAPPTQRPVVLPIYSTMISVGPGTFAMGSEDGYRVEKPLHTVTISRPFSIGVYAVTYEEYDKYTEDIQKSIVNIGVADRGTHPVSGVDWYGAVEYCNWLSEKAGLTPCYSGGGKVTKCDFLADGYRMPTEAEWEFAAQGVIQSQGYLYSGSNDPDEVGWHAGNSDGHAHPVGQKKPNELGIYDMSGNRWEWCWDWFEGEYYQSSPAVDPTGPLTPPSGSFVNRSRRSSSAVQEVDTLRVAFRSYDGVSYPGDNGMRLVQSG